MKSFVRSPGARHIGIHVFSPLMKFFAEIIYFLRMDAGKIVLFTNVIDEVEQIKNFDREGYIFNPSLSSGTDWVFTRKQ